MGSDQKRAFLAIVLSGIVLFGWQALFAPPQQPAPVQKEAPVATNTTQTKSATTPGIVKKDSSKDGLIPVPVGEAKEATVSLGEHKISLNSHLKFLNFQNPGAVFEYHKVVGDKAPFSVEYFNGNDYVPVALTLEENGGGNTLTGENADLGVRLVARLEENGKFHFSLQSKNPLRYRFRYHLDEATNDNRQDRQLLIFSKEVDNYSVGSDDSGEASAKWAGIDFDYHLFAFVFDKRTVLNYRTKEDGVITLQMVEPTANLSGYFVYTKKNYDHLMAMGDNLDLSVDFGMLAVIAIPILRGLQYFYTWVPNYGVAIIFLTLLLRLVTFPLQYKSFKSMKKMQVVQPELQKLREKYKDDPQRMQKETMELFKKAGANPLGGCFPLLLQMPIFFAFYQVLYNAVELVGAPFAGWIGDLSIKDPFYVLPVLMGVSFFFQTKINPSTTADPMQKKLMMFMPLIFCFIMKDLPAGLNLYITVSTLLGIIQQLFVYKMAD